MNGFDIVIGLDGIERMEMDLDGTGRFRVDALSGKVETHAGDMYPYSGWIGMQDNGLYGIHGEMDYPQGGPLRFYPVEKKSRIVVHIGD